MGDRRQPPLAVRLMTATVTGVIAVSVVAGIGAAAVGGSLTNLGSGYGGLWGVPALLLTFVALILGAAAAIGIGRVQSGTGAPGIRVQRVILRV